MTNTFDLQGKVILVTGATGLIGQEYCRGLSKQGAKIAVADVNYEACQELASSLTNEAMALGFDVTKKAEIETAQAAIEERLGPIDGLINNAAINDKFEDPHSVAELSKFESYPEELWRRSMDVNVTGVFLCCQVVGSKMAARGRGSIINIASTYGITAPNQDLYIDKNGVQNFYKTAAYPASKGAVIMLTRFLASYWGKAGVRVNTISPGGVENGQDADFIERYSVATPLKRMAKADDYVGAAVYLSSDASAYVTGHNLVVDGGWTIW